MYVQIINLVYKRNQLIQSGPNARRTNLNPWGKKN